MLSITVPIVERIGIAFCISFFFSLYILKLLTAIPIMLEININIRFPFVEIQLKFKHPTRNEIMEFKCLPDNIGVWSLFTIN